MKAILLKVTGRVQRVDFRRFVLEAAQEVGISGNVGNEVDGSVSIFVQGEKDRLEQFLKRVRRPLPPAAVKDVKEFPAKARPKLRHFAIKFGSVQEELQEGFGAMQNEFSDYRSEFRDYRTEFRGFASRTDENFKHLESKYGEISEKLTSIMNTLIEESKKTREMLEVIKSDSRQTREMLSESMRLLTEAIDRMPGRG